MGKKAGGLLRGTSVFHPSSSPTRSRRARSCWACTRYWLDPSGATHAREELPDSDSQSWPTFFDFLRHEAEETVKLRAERGK